MPKVSVIIPTHNRGRLIGRALESVFKQTYKDYEVIVVDDGSTDNTREVLAQFGNKIKYIAQPQQGSAAARNRGIRESMSEYVAFLDSDDFWIPEKLATQVEILDKHKNVGIVYSKMIMINEKGEQCGMKPSSVSGKNYQELLEIWGDLPTSTVMTRKDYFNKAGLFDQSLTTMQDIDMWLRIARFCDLYEVEDKMLAYYFRHDEQITKNRIKVYEGLIRLQQKILNNYEDVPAASFVKRIAMNQYTLSRTYYNEKFYPKSLQNALAAIGRYPLVGTLFFNHDDNIFMKLFKIIKPYGFLIVCSIRNLFPHG